MIVSADLAHDQMISSKFHENMFLFFEHLELTSNKIIITRTWFKRDHTSNQIDTMEGSEKCKLNYQTKAP